APVRASARSTVASMWRSASRCATIRRARPAITSSRTGSGANRTTVLPVSGARWHRSPRRRGGKVAPPAPAITKRVAVMLLLLLCRSALARYHHRYGRPRATRRSGRDGSSLVPRRVFRRRDGPRFAPLIRRLLVDRVLG